MTCPQSIKFSKLKRRLKLPHWQTVGLLESVWLFAQMNAPRGDIGRQSNEDIAAGIEWDGDPDELIQNLIECGWIDECESNRLLIHDWYDHMPTYLKGALAKNKIEPAKHVAKQPAKQSIEQPAKQSQNDTQQPAPCLALSCPTLGSQSEGSQNTPLIPQGGIVNGQVPVDGSKPSETPNSSNGGRTRRSKIDAPYSEDFERFWESHSPVRKANKPGAWKSWQKAIRIAEPQVIITAAIDYALSPQGLGKFCRGPEPWLNQRGWEDDRRSWQDPEDTAAQLKPRVSMF